MLCAWLLGRRGIPVILFDENDGPQADPRAATTHPATLDLLADDGLADDMAIQLGDDLPGRQRLGRCRGTFGQGNGHRVDQSSSIVRLGLV